eukprot:Rmarinus@m.29815
MSWLRPIQFRPCFYFSTLTACLFLVSFFGNSIYHTACRLRLDRMESPFTVRKSSLGSRAKTVRYDFFDNGKQLTYKDVIVLWQHSEPFREIMVETLANAPYEAFFWECPPVRSNSRGDPFEFVVVDAPSLSQATPDETSFSEHIGDKDGTGCVITFDNLGGDAKLVVPCRGSISADTYTHIASFSRNAPMAQQHEFWRTVGSSLEARLENSGERKTWLSTSGLGVYWLHVRLDSRPKYYTHRPYATTS